MPFTGPTVLALRPFRDVNEESTATLMALSGVSLSARPDLWQDYLPARPRVLAAAKPLGELRKRLTQQGSVIDAGVAQTGKRVEDLVYLPMVARNSFWTVLLDAQSAEVRGFVALDSF